MNRGKSRLLVITELFLPTKGGTAVWFDEVYRRLGGKEIHIVTADVPGGKEYDASHPNAVHRLSLKRYWWLRPESLAMYAKFFFKSFILMLFNDFDAIHAGRVLPEGFVGWLLARLFRKRIIVYAHGEEITTWRQSGKFRAMVFVYCHADRVVANSEFTRAELIKLGVDKQKIALIYPGVDTERFRPGLPCDDLKQFIGLEQGQKLILSVGRLSRRKGFDQVIRSLPYLLDQGLDVHYAIIGIGEDEQYLRNLSHENGTATRVHLLGHVRPADLPRWYNACDLFAMPNREVNGDNEGFGMVFIEAGACGKAVVGGQDGGAGSAIIQNITGVLIDGKDQSKVEQCLTTLLTSMEQCETFGRNSVSRARAKLGWEHVAAETMML